MTPFVLVRRPRFCHVEMVVKINLACLFLLICCPVAFPESLQTCGAGMTPAEAYQKAAAVFAGTVMDVTRLETRLKSGTTVPHHEVKLKVGKSWKLVDREEIVVSTRSVYENTCGSFKVGESYLVYADRMNDTFYVAPASRTSLLANAREDLEFLGGARVALKPGEFRTHGVVTYGILACVAWALLVGVYLYRLHKRPLRP